MCRRSAAPTPSCAAISPATSSTSWLSVMMTTEPEARSTRPRPKTIVELIKKAKVGPKFLKYMRAQSVEEAGSLEAAVTTIAARDYRKAVSTLEEQIAKAEAGHAHLS